jgi:serine/threonine protein phosphatase 1
MRTIRRFEKNTQGSDYVVGDIHGCYRTLDALLKHVNFNPTKDRLFGCGDYADRGANSRECLAYLQRPWFFGVAGNHDIMPFYQIPAWHIKHGGQWFYDSTDSDKHTFYEIMDKLPWAIEVETDHGMVGIIHAEVPDDDWTTLPRLLGLPSDSNNLTGPDEVEEVVMWKREIIRNNRSFEGVRNIDYVCVGHTTHQTYERRANMYFLDTGAYKGWSLTCLRIQGPDAPTVFSVPSTAS